MRSTRDVEGNGRKGDEYKPMDEKDKDENEVQVGLTLVQVGMERKWWVRSKGRREKIVKISFVLLTGLERLSGD